MGIHDAMMNFPKTYSGKLTGIDKKNRGNQKKTEIPAEIREASVLAQTAGGTMNPSRCEFQIASFG
jgi:hypothetical protein